MNSPIFSFKKQLEHSTFLECAVILMPCREAKTVSYTVILSVSGSESSCAAAENFTSDRNEAERIFNRICLENTRPENIASVLPQAKTTR